jgi:DNA-binding winged helix-turn-helix (wHTH) protein
LVENQLNHLQTWNCVTNDIVRIKGALDGDRTLQINGLPLISLGKRAFLVLTILGRYALSRPGAFMTMSDLLDAVFEQTGASTNQKETGFWNDPMPEDVHKIVNLLREEIRKAGGNPLLLESSTSYGGGYRFSTPHSNIIIEDVDHE